jgi:hypothetical protein
MSRNIGRAGPFRRGQNKSKQHYPADIFAVLRDTFVALDRLRAAAAVPTYDKEKRQHLRRRAGRCLRSICIDARLFHSSNFRLVDQTHPSSPWLAFWLGAIRRAFKSLARPN